MVKERNFLLVSGVCKGSGERFNFLNVYAPQQNSAKKVLWAELVRIVGGAEGIWVVGGDFNCVRNRAERRNSNFNVVSFHDFNEFIESAGKFGPKPFRFFNSWLGREDFEEVVANSLKDFQGEGAPYIVLLQKFRCLRRAITEWKVKKLEVEIEEEKDGDLLEEELWVLDESKKKLKELEDYRYKDLKQRARVKWAQEGDYNMRKFVEDMKVRPGHKCFGLKNISEDKAAGLIVPFSEKEIKEAVFECDNNKALGPDDDFGRIFEIFFQKGIINRGVGSSFITLVPKVSDPVALGEYRPFNLIGVVSKTISKVLANRLKGVMGSIFQRLNLRFCLADTFLMVR
ncbi:uncharacterized protein LOC110924832 [Helianthus annuus]|uniref:uncharacterized protein LOC110924832 n=1 Tax=Helianthus annuus TaxID=4232 RepID=UPI000B909C5C|nr:uncharacterized protein LOC110924832 [Helianthus annuus]